MRPLDQHQTEIQRNRSVWERKTLIREIYSGFYHRILRWIDPSEPGLTVEIGSGIGNLRSHLPNSLATDLFPNPWLDLVCDGYELPFPSQSLSHLVLFDVFHHLQRPTAFLHEAHRVLHSNGRLILFEPFISRCSHPIYGLLHHEPVAWKNPIETDPAAPQPRGYYAAQGNATRLFFHAEKKGWPHHWNAVHREAFSAFSYLLSGGFSRPPFFPKRFLPLIQRIDRWLSHWPFLFAARCLIVLQPRAQASLQTGQSFHSQV